MRWNRVLFLFAFFCLINTIQAQTEIRDSSLCGRLIRYDKFKSVLVDTRNIDVWLPVHFDPSGHTRYAVLYMHDGQNLFLSGSAFGGVECQVDETMDSLLKRGLIRNTIVVGIWSTPKRFLEFNATDAFNNMDTSHREKQIWGLGSSTPSNPYLEFIFTELKPFIDQNFPTKPDMKNTFMLGSEMGGLLSLYALCKYSDQIRNVACLKMQWPVAFKSNEKTAIKFIEYFAHYLPNPKLHKIYIDCYADPKDFWNEKQQNYFDQLCTESGYEVPKEFLSKRMVLGSEKEEYQNGRLGSALRFLLQ